MSLKRAELDAMHSHRCRDHEATRIAEEQSRHENGLCPQSSQVSQLATALAQCSTKRSTLWVPSAFCVQQRFSPYFIALEHCSKRCLNVMSDLGDGCSGRIQVLWTYKDLIWTRLKRAGSSSDLSSYEYIPSLLYDSTPRFAQSDATSAYIY